MVDSSSSSTGPAAADSKSSRFADGVIYVCTGVLYLVVSNRVFRKDAEYLKQLPRVNRLNELESKNLPLTVAICGRVGSDTPITSKLSGLKAVIVEEKTCGHRLQRNVKETSTTTTIMVKEGIIKEEKQERNYFDVSWTMMPALFTQEVPWYLDDGTGHVFVVGARCANGFQLTFGGAAPLSDEESSVSDELDDDQGFKILGGKRSEYILQTGTSLTVVGEAVRETDGTIRIQRPREGRFYVSGNTIDQLISIPEKLARYTKYVSYGTMLLGAVLITGSVLAEICSCEVERRVAVETFKRRR